MKSVVINRPFGGFRLPIGFAQKYNFESIWDNVDRDDPRLVDYVENHPEECRSLDIVHLDDDATDWEILEYDGSEQVIAVYDGVIHHL